MGGRPLLVDAILYEILDFGDGPTAAVPLPIKRYRRKRIRITASLKASCRPYKPCSRNWCSIRFRIYLHEVTMVLHVRRASRIGPRNCSFDAFFRSELTEGRAHAERYSHPRAPNAERSTPGGAYHPPER